MPITLNEIPYTWYRKGAYVEARPNYSNKGTAPWPTRVVITGQKLAAGTGAAGVAMPITRLDQATAYFGQGSQLEAMIKIFKLANKVSEIWAFPYDDAGGSVAATKTITVTGTPSVSGTLPLYIAGRRVAVPVTTTDTPTTVAAAIVTAITADPNLMMSATSALGVVTLTAKNKGTVGNLIDVRFGYYWDDLVPPGLTLVIAAGTAGATDPTIQTLITNLANDWYTDIVMPWTDSANMALLETDLARRYNAMGGLDMHSYTGLIGSYATATTWSSTRNSALQSTLPTGPAAPQPPFLWAASLAGVAAFQLGNDPARQLGSLVLPGIMAPLAAGQFLDTEQNLMLGKGLSSWDALPDGTVVLNRVVTNYQKATSGAADTAWLDIMVPKTLSRIRYDWINYVQLTYPRHKLADDTSPSLGNLDPSQGIATPRSLLGSWVGRCRLYAQQGWIEDIEYVKANSFFERDANDRNRANGRQSIKIIGNLIVLAGALEFAA